MLILLELVILCIGITVYILYHGFKQYLGIMTSKIIYWCSLLFMSVAINSVLSASYPDYFSFSYYANTNTLWSLSGIALGCLLLYFISPTSLFKRDKKAKKKKALPSVDTTDLVPATPPTEEPLAPISPSLFLKEIQFESFIEIICWLSFVFTVGLEAYVTLLGHWFLSPTLLLNIKNMTCLMMMITLPLIIRQLIFYIHALRSSKGEQELAETQLQFYRKLNTQKNKL